jgi:hypothetical protein
MNRQRSIMLLVALTLIVSAGGLLGRVRSHQKLGVPGIKHHSLPETIRVAIDLPEKVMDSTSEIMEPDELTVTTLPRDTSLGTRIYTNPDGLRVQLTVVLMGRDRTSMHKPQFCLTGNGWQIDQARSLETTIKIDRPVPYELPVVKLIAMKDDRANSGQIISGVYVYWFVADDALSASVTGVQRMWMMASHVVRTGVLQRWAYVSCFVPCPPGQEDAVFERMKTFISAAVPEFQLVPKPSGAQAASAK